MLPIRSIGNWQMDAAFAVGKFAILQCPRLLLAFLLPDICGSNAGVINPPMRRVSPRRLRDATTLRRHGWLRRRKHVSRFWRSRCRRWRRRWRTWRPTPARAGPMPSPAIWPSSAGSSPSSARSRRSSRKAWTSSPGNSTASKRPRPTMRSNWSYLTAGCDSLGTRSQASSHGSTTTSPGLRAISPGSGGSSTTTTDCSLDSAGK